MKKISFLLMLVVLSVGLFSCTKEAIELPEIEVSFQSSESGFEAAATELEIPVTLSRAADQKYTLTLSVEGELAYEEYFTTEPALTDGLLTIKVMEGQKQASFKLIKTADALFDGDEQLTVSLAGLSEGMIAGSNEKLQITFGQIRAEKGSVDAQVGGEQQPKQVFIDLTALRQTAVARNSWDLGFYNGNDFRVIMNHTAGAMIRPTEKTAMADLTSADIEGWENEMSFSAFNSDAAAWVDNPTGDLEQTAMGEISEKDADNKVFVVMRGTNPDGSERGWQKIRVLRSGENYILRYAAIDATTYQEVTISKDEAYNFSYFSFDDGTVQVEPEKNKWDISFTIHSEYIAMGPGSNIPYSYKDFVLQNRNGVETAMIMEEEMTYDTFTTSDIEGMTFNAEINAIGANWRKGGGPNSQPELYIDRFFLIKDAESNYYKLKFTRLTLDGQRGYPQIQFELIR